MFSPLHILSIVVCAFLTYCFIKLLKTKNQTQITTLLKILALVIFLLNPINWLWDYYTYGSLNLEVNLPLHLCSIYWFFFPVVIFIKGENKFKQIIFANCATIGFIGGILGLLMNTHLNAHPFFSFPVVRSLAYHYLMIFCSIVLWVYKIYIPKKSDLYTYFLPVIVLVLICVHVEAVYGYEYCYVRTGAGTPFVIISPYLPQALYIFLIYLLYFVVTSLIFYRKYVLEVIQDIKNKNKNKNKTKNHIS